MGHHLTAEGRFQSDKHPELRPDKIVLSFTDRRAWGALRSLADACMRDDPELAGDIHSRLDAIMADFEALSSSQRFSPP